MKINLMLPAYAPADAGAVATDEQKPASEAGAKPADGTPPSDAAKKPAAEPPADGKKDGEQPPAQKPAAEAAAIAAPAGAPEKYALKVPDGSLISASDLRALEDQARTANLTNEDAQAWLEEQALYAKRRSDAFYAETLADPELGGDRIAETQRRVNAVIDRLYPADDPHREPFLVFLKSGGANNNIHVVRAFDRLATLMAEDTVVPGKAGGAESPKDAASVLYGGTMDGRPR